MAIVSLDAMSGPRRVVTKPVGAFDVVWIANAPVTGDGDPSFMFPTSSRPSLSMCDAPL